MKRALVALAVLPGCFTSWATLQLTGQPGAWQENEHKERVPLPGVKETLVVSLPIADATPSGFHFRCEANQLGRDAVYTASSRYGRGWRRATVIMFLAEAALGTALLLTGKDDPGALAAGAYFGVDALGTAALFFAPRKDLYQRSEESVNTEVRQVCPDGVVVEIAGDSFPLDAAGGLGDLGNAALDEWMRQPTGPSGQLVVSFAGRTIPLQVGDNERCAWNRQRDASPRQPGRAYCPAPPNVIAAVIELPAGTLTQVATGGE